MGEDLNIRKKPIVLIFVGNFLPGFKAGGILRSIVNTVDWLSEDFEFLVLTRDRDIGEEIQYPGILYDEWQAVGKAKIRYLKPEQISMKYLRTIIDTTPHDVLYLNSFFEKFTILTLASRKFRKFKNTAVVLAPRGEFGWASLKLKYSKKLVFIRLAKIFGLYNDVVWHASSEFEKKDIIDVMGVPEPKIHVALDLPTRFSHQTDETAVAQEREDLKIVFLSRISREKNLDFALKVLGEIKLNVTFDIYGPQEDLGYWNECKLIIDNLPSNIIVNYNGIVNPDQVIGVFQKYDLFFFPSGGENYGHVIAESLTSGTPVLISENTPWRNLDKEGLGWDLKLDKVESFKLVIEELASTSASERLTNRHRIKSKIMEKLSNSNVLDDNRALLMPSNFTKLTY